MRFDALQSEVQLRKSTDMRLDAHQSEIQPRDSTEMQIDAQHRDSSQLQSFINQPEKNLNPNI